jgi:Zn-dependent protease with chaperone function
MALDDAGPPPSVGIIIAVTIAAMIGGAAAGQHLHDSTPALAWVTAGGLCGGLFGLGKLFARRGATRVRFLTLLALVFLTFSYLLVLGGESIPRASRRSTLEFISLIFALLGILAASIALPLVIVAAGLWQKHGPRSPGVVFNVGPGLIAVAVGTVTFTISLLSMAVAIRFSPPPARVGAILAIAFACPMLLPPVWASAYQRLLSRWETAAIPHSLLDGLRTLRVHTGFAFRRVQCLEAAFGGRTCQVVTAPGRASLIISESIPRDLTSEQLLAVLAHEAAHVSFGHTWRKIAWGTIGTAVTIAMTVATGILIAPFVPRSMEFAGVLVAVLPITVVRRLYDTFVVRRHETEADEFAIDVAGATALLDALTALGGAGPTEALVPNRWTTHGSRERRLSRIHEREKSVQL